MTTASTKDASRPSRKSKVHALFAQQGPEAAWTLGLKLRLKEGTLRSWFGTWRRDDQNKPKSKKAKPKSAKVVAPEPAPQPTPVAA